MILKSQIEDIYFLGAKISIVDYGKVHMEILGNLRTKAYVCLVSAGSVITATKDEKHCTAIRESMLSIADGMPIYWFGRLSGYRNIDRIAGMEMMKRFVEEDNGLRHFLLGDTKETIAKVIKKARKANSCLKIVGYSPPFRTRFDEDDNVEIAKQINREKPDLIWVALGGGKQEAWMKENIHRIEKGIMIGVGAAFRYYINDLKTPPKLFQRLGMQWIFRVTGDHETVIKQILMFPKFVAHFPKEVICCRIKKRQELQSRQSNQ